MTISLKRTSTSTEMKRGQEGWESPKQYCSGPRKGGAEELTSDWEISPATSHKDRIWGPGAEQGGQLQLRPFHEAGTLKCYSLSVKEPEKVHVSTQASSSEACLCPRIWVSKGQIPAPLKPQAHATPRYGVRLYTFLGIWDSPVWDWYRHCFWASCRVPWRNKCKTSLAVNPLGIP